MKRFWLCKDIKKHSNLPSYLPTALTMRIKLLKEFIAGFVRLRGNLEKGTFLEKIRENLENLGNFLTIFTTSGKTQGILFCQISLPSSLGHFATNQTDVLLTGTLTNPATAF